MEKKIITIKITKKARKYYYGLINEKYNATILINEVSKNLEIDSVVKIEVEDLSTYCRYGASLKFEPIAILTDEEVNSIQEESQKIKEAKKYLKYAEDHIDKGFSQTKSILKAIELSDGIEELQERVTELKINIQKNKEAFDKAKKERQIRRDKEDEERIIAKIANQKEALKREYEEFLSGKGTRRDFFPYMNAPELNKPVKDGKHIIVYVKYGATRRINEDDPSCNSGLLGHEGEKGIYCYYRLANAEEIALYQLEQKKIDECFKIKKSIENIKDIIKKQGARPTGKHSLQGERFFNTQNIYGGGDWVVIDQEYIWYIQNNGMDGDYWGDNNILTGGAGGIGWRVPFNKDMAAEIMELEKLRKAHERD